ncbi:uncharacterized protein [Nicotiana tomentosiformis]|uniref:uncharacterized protein n=1 Tax=Nicotiana tomentosiformis TaxID=4098 RepID=UPI00051B4502|nr:uncharacterized protein LOC104102813 [Nicotiana tomentosiformis]
MDYPTAIVPYHDPFDDSCSIGQISLFDENPTIGLPKSAWNQEPFTFDPTILKSDNDFGVYDPFDDPILLDIPYECNDYLVENSTNTEAGVQDGVFENKSHVSVWPVSSSTSMCTNNCQILREITHSNGLQISKLNIYGTLGRISHAVLEKYTSDFSSQSHESPQIFDFSKDSTSSVKQFLVQYFEACKLEGYILLQDPLCDFYEALGVGSDDGDILDIDSLLQLSPTISRDCQMNQQEMKNESEANCNDMRHEKIPLSAQRERTGKLRLKDFAGYLHLPIEIAAKKLNICPTVMKKVCRRDGLLRWPYRKIKSIKRKISKREKSLSSSDVEERASAKAEIAKLEEELAKNFEAFVS